MEVLGEGSSIIGDSPMDETIPRLGRPYGGCAISWNPGISAYLESVECKHVCICGITVLKMKHLFLFLMLTCPVIIKE